MTDQLLLEIEQFVLISRQTLPDSSQTLQLRFRKISTLSTLVLYSPSRNTLQTQNKYSIIKT